MRIFLLLVLIAWWMIPFMWIFGWPLFYLLTGASEATATALFAMKWFWFGDIDHD